MDTKLKYKLFSMISWGDEKLDRNKLSGPAGLDLFIFKIIFRNFWIIFFFVEFFDEFDEIKGSTPNVFKWATRNSNIVSEPFWLWPLGNIV